MASAGDGSAGLALPWGAGETGWSSTQGTHNWNGTGASPASSLDFAKVNGVVRAAADGVVRYRSCRGGFLLMIDHANNVHTSYYHLRNISVSDGQSVTRGTALGVTGRATPCGGYATADHVHFTMWRFAGTFSFAAAQEASIVGVDVGGWTVGTGCLTRLSDGASRCPGQPVENSGSVGSGAPAPTATTLVFRTSLLDRSGGYPINNTNPVHRQRTMFIQVYNAQNQVVISSPANAAWISGTSDYGGTIVSSNLPSGPYTIKLRMDYTLFKQVNNGIVNLTRGRSNTIPTTKLTVGDVNQDNALSNTDYSIIQSCLGANPCSSTDKRGSDVDDNGKVDIVDLNLLQRQRFCSPCSF